MNTWRIFLLVIFCLIYSRVYAYELKFDSSTQLLWGDDLLGDSQTIISQYLRFNMSPSDHSRFRISGYGRIWDNFGDTTLRETDEVRGRLYYLYLDFLATENLSFRFGRQFVNFSAGSSLMDGLSADIKNIGPLGITFAGGRDVKFSLDSEHSRFGNYFAGLDIHLENLRSLRLGASYVRKYDEWDLAREEFGLNFRYLYRYVSPYAEIRYDNLSKTIDEATVGADIFPLSDLMLKAEFYHSYPTFDSTSIYSVFAVDRYNEYLLRAEYSLEAPVTIYTAYVRQTYEDSDSADNYIIGARLYPRKYLKLDSSINYRNGYGGNIWGFEIKGDYEVNEKLMLAAGIQYDSYRRPDFSEEDYDYAQRYWIGGKWKIGKTSSLLLRIENNVNENFNSRPMGRIALNMSF
ncbi:MAG: hypothetical protein N2257_03635 [Thermodesulfovibrionales bacterium]|nr:hypothetical protein [Thermodesulfovibrionales bacterium]